MQHIDPDPADPEKYDPYWGRLCSELIGSRSGGWCRPPGSPENVVVRLPDFPAISWYHIVYGGG